MANFDAFMGGSYESQAVTADQERTINWYPEVLQSGGATAKKVLYPTPGVQQIGTLTKSGVGRGHFGALDMELAVIGQKVWSISETGSFWEAYGAATDDGQPVTFCHCPQTLINPQIFITSGGNGILINRLGPNTWLGGPIAALAGKATQGGFLDGRFIVLDAETSTFYISAVFDGSTWSTGTEFAKRSLAPDPWRAMKVVGRYIWLFGEVTTEIWQDVGANFPFAPFPSTLIPYGIAAPYSVALVGPGVAWLARTSGGKVCVVYSAGQNPQVISSYPIESALDDLDVDAAVGNSYSENGHTFYLLSIDGADVTYVWDLETGLWHE